MAALTPEEIAWAASVGISARRAEWLATCPKFTRWDYEKRSVADRNLWKNGNVWFLRMKRRGVQIVERLSTDIDEARRLRDSRIAQINANTIPQ
jgi:hypothetical protein